MDVICGRGKIATRHPGNKRFRTVVLEHLQEYKTAKTKIDKGLIVSKVVDLIEGEGGNFIKKDSNGGWAVVDTTFAREKTAHTIRDFIRSSSQQNQETPRLSAKSKSGVGDFSKVQTSLFDLQQNIFLNMTQEQKGDVEDDPCTTMMKPLGDWSF